MILVVDDEQMIIDLYKNILSFLGYHVAAYTKPIEALDAFRGNPDKFDVVITDCAMPEMQGDQLAAELLKIDPDIPILLCTGFSKNISKEKALSMGIKGFLMKPIDIASLDIKIRDVINASKLM